MINNKQHWSELTLKEKVTISTAIASFGLGWLIIFLNFFIPPMGEVNDSSLWIMGQSLIYTGSVLGISIYLRESKKDLTEYIRQSLDGKK